MEIISYIPYIFYFAIGLIGSTIIYRVIKNDRSSDYLLENRYQINAALMNYKLILISNINQRTDPAPCEIKFGIAKMRKDEDYSMNLVYPSRIVRDLLHEVESGRISPYNMLNQLQNNKGELLIDKTGNQFNINNQ